MGEIPRDIEMTAFRIANGWSRDDVERADIQADIQRALLSERERCAKIADGFDDGDSYSDWSNAACQIATAIRQEEGKQ